MIKKFLMVFTLAFVTGISYGENMSFVTVMSSPIGAFANLEVANTTQPTSVATVNFCTPMSSSGTILLQGTTGANLGNLILGNNAGVTSNARELRVPSLSTRISVTRGGNLIGGSLLANELNVANAQDVRLVVPSNGSNTGQVIVGSNSSVEAAHAKNLRINRGSNVQDQFNYANVQSKGMVWSNYYLADYASDGSTTTVSSYQTQYLLKGKPKASTFQGVNFNQLTGVTVNGDTGEIQLPEGIDR